MRKESLRIQVNGQTESGKSWWIKHMVLPLFGRVLIVDPLEEYSRFVDATVYSVEEARAWLVARRAGYAGVPFRLAFVPRDPKDTVRMLEVAWSIPDSLVVIEELDQIAEPGHAPPALRQLVQRGRHRRISVVTTTQRPSRTPTDFRSQVDLIVVFRLLTPHDQKAVEFAIFDDPATLAKLRQGEYRYFSASDKPGRYGLRLTG